MEARELLLRAADLVSGDRAQQHGPLLEAHQNIAALWNAYLDGQVTAPIRADQVLVMMALLKIGRTKTGAHNEDDYTDAAGYMALAGEVTGESK